MRIVFAGSHGVGKSTLITEISKEMLPDIYVFNSLCRPHEKLLSKLSARGKQRFINYWYVFNHWKTASYLSARSIYDTWAYSQLTVNSDFHLNLFHWAMHHIWYDYLFYVPVEFDLVEDGIRPEGRDFQLLHDKRLKAILDYNQIPYHTLTGTIEKRTQQVKDILGYD